MAQEQPILAELKVLDLSWIVAGPTVGRALADFGATVIRVESSARVDTARVVGPFHGDEPGIEHSGLYGNVNAGKLGIALDLRVAEAREVLRDLVRWADVMCESFTAGVLEQWDLHYDALREIKPDLIMLSSTLLGQYGPELSVSGFGTQGAGMSGVLDLTGWPDRPPAGPYGPYTDYPAPRFALTALLAALEQRRRTGQGAHIDQAQAEATLHLLAPALIDHVNGGPALQRQGNDDPQMSPHGVYPSRPPADIAEAWIAIAVRNEADWRSLAGVIDGLDPALTLLQRRERAAQIDSAIAAWTAERSSAEAEAALQAAGVPAHGLSSTADAANDPQLAHRGHFVRLPHPLHGETVVEAPRYRLSDTPGAPTAPAPQVGEHATQILRDILNYSDAEITALAAAGALS